jgi:hypothetical protein
MEPNLDTDPQTQKLFWRINLSSIHSNFFNIIGFEKFGEDFLGRVLVCRGEKSLGFESGVFKNLFPNLNEETDVVLIKDASKNFLKCL